MPTSGKDRRRAQRAPVHGHAVVHGDRDAFIGSIDNLSLTGVRLHLTEAPGRTDALELELHLPRRTLSLTGRGVRVERDARGARLAARFGRVRADAEDTIADAVSAAFAASRLRPVLVVDSADARRHQIAAALRDRRMTPLVARTPLEAIDLLSRPERQVAVCLVSSRFATHAAEELESVIAESFPWVRVLRLDTDGSDVVNDAAETWDEIEARAWGSG